MNKKNTVTISIAAYNAQENIQSILKSLLVQKLKNHIVGKIIVYSDSSRDDTVKKVQQLKNSQIKIIDGKKRIGFAGVVEKILKISAGEIVVILNDDVKISDKEFIAKLILPFEKESNIGMVGGNPQPLPAKTFVEKAILSSFRAYEKMRLALKNGNNIYACDGKALALSKPFIKSLTFPSNRHATGNVDAFLYLSCLKNGYKYIHSRQAILYFRFPTSLKDYLSWTTRNNSNFYLLKKRFGKKAEDEFHKPKLILGYFQFIEFLKNPTGCILIYFSRFYINLKAKLLADGFSSIWNPVESTKNLN